MDILKRGVHMIQLLTMAASLVTSSPTDLRLIRRSKPLIVIAALFLLSIVTPIKVSVNTPMTNVKYACFIVRPISSGSTEGGIWLCIGDENGYWEGGIIPVVLQGNVPQKILSSTLYDNGENTFIVYGLMESNNTINCRKWDILGEVSRSNNSLRIPFKRSITLYDLKFFDFILSEKSL